MLNFKTILSLAILSLTSPAFASDFVCPTPDHVKSVTADKGSFSREKMYKPMVVGSHAPRSDGPSKGAVFVGEHDFGNREILDNIEVLNQGLFAEFRELVGLGIGSYAKSSAKSGMFKIDYAYNAAECRRQIILGKQIRTEDGSMQTPMEDSGVPTGYFNGFTAIEICDPNVAGLFVAAKEALNNEKHPAYQIAIDKLGSAGTPTINHILLFAEIAHQAGQIDANKLYELKKRLALDGFKSLAVAYNKDKDGDLLPRFAVHIQKLHYEMVGGICELVIDHDDRSDNYAGMNSTVYGGKDYRFNISPNPKTPSDKTLYYWNLDDLQSGKTSSTTYTYAEAVEAFEVSQQ